MALIAGFASLINAFLPLSPRPPSPPGKGETKVFLCKGLRPLHPRGLRPGGAGERRNARARRGHNGFGRRICQPYQCFPAPIPPTPFPTGRGRLLVYFAGGWRPRHPCTEPLTALTSHAIQATPRGAEPGRRGDGVQRTRPEGGHGDFGRRVCQAHHKFLPLSPRPPSRREGGDF